MKLIADGKSLSEMLGILIEKHEHVYFAVAWASAETTVFKNIKKNKNKIKKAVIGTHFYQTHPDVLKSFVRNKHVRFVLQPQGAFHPKIYFFFGKESWDLLIGSANLTAGAMSCNSELVLHVSSEDNEDSLLKSAVLRQIDTYYEMGEMVTSVEVEKYCSLWRLQQPRLRRLSGSYFSVENGKSPIHTKIMSMSWDKYYQLVQGDINHGCEQRCDLLELARKAFRDNLSFSCMEDDLRKTIAGLPNELCEYAGWFGSMKGAGCFRTAINGNDKFISKSLDHIPVNGVVTKDCYKSYVKQFIRAFPNGRHGVGTASRLLAMKRPDYFVCLDAKNRANICNDFNVQTRGMTYDRYWEDLICRIHDSVWWNSSLPKSELERKVWQGRVAMLDAIFYEE